MDCTFCNIANKTIPSNILYEDNDIMAIMDAYPTANGHVLIIPKKHYDDYLALDSSMLSIMFKKAQELGPMIMQKLGAKSITLLINYGDDQVVKHLHLHLIPNFSSNVKNLNTEKEEVTKIYNILNK